MEKFFKEVSVLAQKSLFYEVLLSPKPGLVDRNNSGAHDDMDIFTFTDSILVLGEYFEKCASSGYFHNGKEFSTILDVIRPLGIEAEKMMFAATDGINTHKGAIFIFGILSAAVGSIKSQNEVMDIESITSRAGEISKNILKDFELDFSKKEELTYGEKQYLKYGSHGIRGEAKDGFPSILIAYKVLIDNLKSGYDFQVSMGEAFLKLTEIVFDSNVVGRKGIEGLNILKESAMEIVKLGGYKTAAGLCKLEEIDKKFIKLRISPGGCADLSAATVFLYWVIEKCKNL